MVTSSKSSKNNQKTKKDLKKEEILEEARNFFAKYGYKKTSVKEIAESIGLDQATLYYYFKNKKTLYVECLFKEMIIFKKKVNKEVLGKSSTDRELITSFFTERLKFFHEKNIIDNFHDLNIRKITSYVRNQIVELQNFERKVVVKLLNQAQNNNEIPPTNIAHLASVLIEISQGIRYKMRMIKILGGSEIKLDVFVAELEQSIAFIFDTLRKNHNSKSKTKPKTKTTN